MSAPAATAAPAAPPFPPAAAAEPPPAAPTPPAPTSAAAAAALFARVHPRAAAVRAAAAGTRLDGRTPAAGRPVSVATGSLAATGGVVGSALVKVGGTSVLGGVTAAAVVPPPTAGGDGVLGTFLYEAGGWWGEEVGGGGRRDWFVVSLLGCCNSRPPEGKWACPAATGRIPGCCGPPLPGAVGRPPP